MKAIAIFLVCWFSAVGLCWLAFNTPHWGREAGVDRRTQQQKDDDFQDDMRRLLLGF